MNATQPSSLVSEIRALKEKRRAVILAHNYQIPEIQDVADYVGDSLGLAQQAAATDAEVIAFCGVHFMAETAKILNPNKVVVLPDRDAGCSLEESCPAQKLADLQRTNINVPCRRAFRSGRGAGRDRICRAGCEARRLPGCGSPAPGSRLRVPLRYR